MVLSRSNPIVQNTIEASRIIAEDLDGMYVQGSRDYPTVQATKSP